MSNREINSDDSSNNNSINEKRRKSGVYAETPRTLLDGAELVTEKGNIVTKDGVVVSTEQSDYSLSTNVFKDPEVKAYYTAIYEKAQYECRHLFDADAEWTVEEEKAVIRKLDWRVTLWACVMFIGLQVDRGNLAQAVSGTFLKDLKLSTNDYNFGNAIFTTSFLLAEVPSQLISKKIGPDRWIPIQMVLWSTVAMSQAALTGRRSFLITRSLLGVLEGGFIPDLVLWLSYFYTSKELPIRLSFFWTSLSICGVATALAAFGIFHLEGYHGLAGWRWLFLLEGIVTFLIGVASFFLMPASAVQTKTWFRPNGWFSDRELTIVVNRVLRDDPSKGDMHNRQAITPKRLWKAVCDYDLWPIYAIGLVCFIPPSPPGTYLTLSLKGLGFSTFNTNLLTIPSAVAHIFTLLGLTWLSERWNERALTAAIQPLWIMPCLIAIVAWPGFLKKAHVWGTYGLINVLLAYPYNHAINVGWASRNSNNVGSRSVSTALYNMFVQVGGITATQIYVAKDAPLYKNGNRRLLYINILSLFLFLFAKGYYVFRNKQRDKKWNDLTKEEQKEYTRNTTDNASRRLDFRFTH